MGSVSHARGRLPQRVYWTRRGLVLLVALALVFGIGKLLGGNGSDPSSDAQASNASAQQSNAPSGEVGPVAVSQGPKTKAKGPLLPPSGACRDDELTVLPAVPRAWGGAAINIRLGIQGLQPACTFKVSPKSLVVKITSGNDGIWSSQQCPKSIPTSDVVVRAGVPTYVNVSWSGRRADDSCSSHANWALPGFYHVFAAALGSTPNDVQFEVTRGAPLHKTMKPKPTESASPTSTPGGKASGKPSGTPKPSGQATPTKPAKPSRSSTP